MTLHFLGLILAAESPQFFLDHCFLFFPDKARRSNSVAHHAEFIERELTIPEIIIVSGAHYCLDIISLACKSIDIIANRLPAVDRLLILESVHDLIFGRIVLIISIDVQIAVKPQQSAFIADHKYTSPAAVFSHTFPNQL